MLGGLTGKLTATWIVAGIVTVWWVVGIGDQMVSFGKFRQIWVMCSENGMKWSTLKRETVATLYIPTDYPELISGWLASKVRLYSTLSTCLLASW